jgi:hypothetical protein
MVIRIIVLAMTIVMLFFCVNNIKRKKNKKKEESKKNNTGDGGNKFAKFVLLGFDRFFSGKKLRNPGGFPRPPRFLFFPTDREIVALDLHIGPTRRSKTVEIVKILSQDVKKDDDE